MTTAHFFDRLLSRFWVPPGVFPQPVYLISYDSITSKRAIYPQCLKRSCAVVRLSRDGKL